MPICDIVFYAFWHPCFEFWVLYDDNLVGISTEAFT